METRTKNTRRRRTKKKPNRSAVKPKPSDTKQIAPELSDSTDINLTTAPMTARQNHPHIPINTQENIEKNDNGFRQFEREKEVKLLNLIVKSTLEELYEKESN